MPYKIKKQGNEFCVFNSETGDNKGCSDSRKKAIGHMRALYAAEGSKASDNKALDEMVNKSLYEDEKGEMTIEKCMSEYGDGDYYEHYVPWGITTFSALEEWRNTQDIAKEMRSTTSDFVGLVENIMGSYEFPTMDAKLKAMQVLLDELGNQLATEGQGQGEGMDDSTTTDKAMKSNPVFVAIKGLLTKAGVLKEKESETATTPVATANHPRGLMIYKSTDSDTWEWVARYSNNFRDRDNPSEIISEASHKRFVERVDKGLAPLPELWIWHEKALKIGSAHYVAWDDSGFAIAAGTFDPGYEQVAKALSESPIELGVSHGMPKNTIKRDIHDSSIICEHETKEISVLPLYAAANELTGFLAFAQDEKSLKEDEDMIPEDKKKALIALGLSEEALSLIETRNATDAQKAVAEGIQRKENGVTTPPATTETAPVATATSAANTETPATVAVATATATPATTPEESKDTELAEIKSLLKDLGNAMVSLAQEVAVVKTAQANQEKQIKETVVKELSVTPVSSIDALVNSIIGKADARVDGRDSLAKSKPAETKPTYEPGPTLVPFVNQFLADPAKK